VVKKYTAELGFRGVAPHDLRRSCAKLCHAAGGELEQIQFLLGHVSVQTTERYPGCKQRIGGAVNNWIGIERSGPDFGVRRRLQGRMDLVHVGSAFAVPDRRSVAPTGIMMDLCSGTTLRSIFRMRQARW
jgi:hypothetical protein